MLRILDDAATGGLGEIRIASLPGTFALTPASLISLQAIGKSRSLLRGMGIDWGSGSGCLAIAAANIAAVEKVFGLEISPANVQAAMQNAVLNRVASKIEFFLADSYTPALPRDKERLLSQRGRIDFVIANPPAAPSGDGFEYRRIVLSGAADYLRPGGVVFLSISFQYGMERIRQLERDVLGFRHRTVLASTDWVPFDLVRVDLLDCLRLYTATEASGGLPYTFRIAGSQEEHIVTAQAALAHFVETGESPLSRWQTHLFEYCP